MTRPAVPPALLVPLPDDPPWLALSLAALAEDSHEVHGVGMSPFIASLYVTLGLDPLAHQDDTSPWCAIDANAFIKRAGYKPWARVFAARGALSWGMPCAAPHRGCFAVLDRVDPTQPNVLHGHVTCVLGMSETPGWFYGVGGNTHNRHAAESYELSRVVGIRRPLVKL